MCSSGVDIPMNFDGAVKAIQKFTSPVTHWDLAHLNTLGCRLLLACVDCWHVLHI